MRANVSRSAPEGDPSFERDVPQDTVSKRRFAASGFPDQAEEFILSDSKRNIVQDLLFLASGEDSQTVVIVVIADMLNG